MDAVVIGHTRIWVTCSDCGEERLVPKSYTKQARFTGRCRKCFMVEAKRGMNRYFQKWLPEVKEV